MYVRLGSTNRKADRELIAELRRSAEGIAFDEIPMPELTEDHLDFKAARKLFSGRSELDERELITLKLLRRDQGKLVPTKGAVLLFGTERTFHFPDAWVQCGRFIGTDKTGIFDHIELDEPLPTLVESILLFLRKHAMRGADFSEIQRKDVWSIPLTILREAVINALVHADYSQRGAPIRISFFDDRIEIENPGILLPGMTIEDMKQGVSRIRNPVIARVFRELKLIEQWGSGVPSIIREAHNLGLPEPLVQEIGMRLRFTVFLAKPNILAELESSYRTRNGHISEPEKSSEKILRLLAENPKMTIAELAEELAISTRAIEKNIQKLRDSGLVSRIGPDKGGYWEVQNRDDE